MVRVSTNHHGGLWLVVREDTHHGRLGWYVETRTTVTPLVVREDTYHGYAFGGTWRHVPRIRMPLVVREDTYHGKPHYNLNPMVRVSTNHHVFFLA